MNRYLLIFNIMFILSCNLKKTNNSKKANSSNIILFDRKTNNLDIITSNSSKKIESKRPYNFVVDIRFKKIEKENKNYDINTYNEYNHKGLKIVEDVEAEEILVKLVHIGHIGFKNIFTDSRYIIKIEKNNIEYFRNALLNGGSFQCITIPIYDSDDKNLLDDKNKDLKEIKENVIVIKGKDNSCEYIFFNISNNNSFAIEMNDIKEYL